MEKSKKKVVALFCLCFILFWLFKLNELHPKESLTQFVVPIQQSVVKKPILASFPNKSTFNKPVLYFRTTLCLKEDSTCYRRFLMTTGDYNTDTKFMPKESFRSCFYIERNGKKYQIKSLPSLASLSTGTESHHDISIAFYARYEYKSLEASLSDPREDLKISLLANKTAFSETKYYKLDNGLDILGECDKSLWFRLQEKEKYGLSAESRRYNVVDGCSTSTVLTKPQVIQREGIMKHQKYDILFHGDSQPTYTCNQLRSYSNVSNEDFTKAYFKYSDVGYLSVYCNRHNGPITNGFEYYVSLFRKFLVKGTKNRESKKKYFINFSGLWDSSRGQMKILSANVTNYKEKIKVLLEIVVDFVRTREDVEAFIMTTTLVQPLLYKGIWGDRHKYSMTQTRVEFINKVLLQHYSSISESKRIHLLDVGQMSKVGENDPLDKNDMRHLGYITNEKLIKYILCQAFPQNKM